jgi:hypothetical protein
MAQAIPRQQCRSHQFLVSRCETAIANDTMPPQRFQSATTDVFFYI